MKQIKNVSYRIHYRAYWSRKSRSRNILEEVFCKPFHEGRPPRSVYAGASSPHYAKLNPITHCYSFQLPSPINISFLQICRFDQIPGRGCFDMSSIWYWHLVLPSYSIKHLIFSISFLFFGLWCWYLVLHTYSIRPLWYAQMEIPLDATDQTGADFNRQDLIINDLKKYISFKICQNEL